jgi:hypothetical protein
MPSSGRRGLMSSRRNRNIQPDAQPDNGYNFNSGNPNGQPNMNNLNQLFNNMDLNQILGQISQMMGGGPQGGVPNNPQMQQPGPSQVRDPRIQLLQAVKPFVNRRRGAMIDGIGQLYAIAKIIKGSGRK